MFYVSLLVLYPPLSTDSSLFRLTVSATEQQEVLKGDKHSTAFWPCCCSPLFSSTFSRFATCKTVLKTNGFEEMLKNEILQECLEVTGSPRPRCIQDHSSIFYVSRCCTSVDPRTVQNSPQQFKGALHFSLMHQSVILYCKLSFRHKVSRSPADSGAWP